MTFSFCLFFSHKMLLVIFQAIGLFCCLVFRGLHNFFVIVVSVCFDYWLEVLRPQQMTWEIYIAFLDWSQTNTSFRGLPTLSGKLLHFAVSCHLMSDLGVGQLLLCLQAGTGMASRGQSATRAAMGSQPGNTLQPTTFFFPGTFDNVWR